MKYKHRMDGSLDMPISRITAPYREFSLSSKWIVSLRFGIGDVNFFGKTEDEALQIAWKWWQARNIAA